MNQLDLEAIEKDLKIDAHALGIPEGAAEVFVERSIKGALKSLKAKSIITESDLNRALIKELKKYHADFAYVYENRDKII